MNRESIILKIKEIKDQQTALKAQEEELWEALGPLSIGSEVHDNVILKVSEQSRFNAATAKRNLDKDTLKSISKLTPDSALAKAVLDEDEFKILCCNQSIIRKIEIVKD